MSFKKNKIENEYIFKNIIFILNKFDLKINLTVYIFSNEYE